MSNDLKQVTKQVFIEHLATFLDNLDICQQVQERLETQFTPLQKQLVNQYYYHLFSQPIQNLIENSEEKEIEQSLQNLSINSQKRPFSDVEPGTNLPEPEPGTNNCKISCYYFKSNPNKLRHLEILETRDHLIICKDLETSQIKSFYKDALKIVEGTLESNPIKKIKFTYKHSNPELVRELIVTKTNAKYIFGKESENGKIKCFKKNGINYI